jgi:hypothetical protein
MNHAAWLALQGAEQDPTSYRPTEELFTPEGLLYGVMLHPLGKRYGAEMNGTRRSGWGDGQNRDFQETAPFLALRSDKPLVEAIAEGRTTAARDPELAKAMGTSATPQQMAFWMSELIDIALLDHLFGQQDRIGNVDYLPFWYWIEDGRLERRPASGTHPPADLSDKSPVYLRRTELGDNDAGIRRSYLNYSKRTGMLEKMRHFRADTYRRLLALEADFAASGPLRRYLETSFGLSAGEFEQILANTVSAAAILRANCKAGRLRFDVEPTEFLLQDQVTERRVDCEQP